MIQPRESAKNPKKNRCSAFPVIFEPSLRLYFLRKLFIAALSGGKKCTSPAVSKQRLAKEALSEKQDFWGSRFFERRIYTTKKPTE
jgi:hypothetical protein